MWGWLRRVVARMWEAVDGLKTLGTVVFFVLLGVADYTDTVNIKPVLDSLLGEDKAAKIMMLMPIVFGTLRFVSSGRVRFRRPRECREEFDELNQKEPH